MGKQIDMFNSDYNERLKELWCEKAYEKVVEYAKKNEFFIAENVRLKYQESLPNYDNKLAWGGIFKKAKGAGVIENHGYDTAKSDLAHGRPTTLWKSTVFTNRQHPEEMDKETRLLLKLSLLTSIHIELIDELVEMELCVAKRKDSVESFQEDLNKIMNGYFSKDSVGIIAADYISQKSSEIDKIINY